MPPEPELESSSWKVSDVGAIPLPAPPSAGSTERAGGGSPDPFAASISLERDPFARARAPEKLRDDPFAVSPASSSIERESFSLPIEPAEALAESLSPLDDPFAPPPAAQASCGAPGGPRTEFDSLDLVGPLDLHPPGENAAAMQDVRAPGADLEPLLRAAEPPLSRPPGLALDGGAELALGGEPGPAFDGEPGLALGGDADVALDRNPTEAARTPRGPRAAATGPAGAGEAIAEARALGPSRRAHDFTPAATPAAGASDPGGALGTPPGQVAASGTAEARRPRASAAAAALSLVFLVLAAAIAFVAWRRSMGAHPYEAPRSGIEARDVSAGPYDTAAGTTVLVVRGRVTARERVVGSVRVEAELWDRGDLVATAEGAAGASATPEEVYAAGTQGEAEALRRALDARAVRRLAAGESAPFLLLFPPPAPDMRGRELRVAASAVAGPSR